VGLHSVSPTGLVTCCRALSGFRTTRALLAHDWYCPRESNSAASACKTEAPDQKARAAYMALREFAPTPPFRARPLRTEARSLHLHPLIRRARAAYEWSPQQVTILRLLLTKKESYHLTIGARRRNYILVLYYMTDHSAKVALKIARLTAPPTILGVTSMNLIHSILCVIGQRPETRTRYHMLPKHVCSQLHLTLTGLSGWI
jgi:hypothetical protein